MAQRDRVEGAAAAVGREVEREQADQVAAVDDHRGVLTEPQQLAEDQADRGPRGRGRRVAITVEVIDPASGDREVVYRPRHELPWAPVEAPARGSAFVHDCDFTRGDNPCDVVEATSVGARVMVRGVARALDVSADGRYLLVRRDPRARAGRATAWPDLVVIELSTGREVRVVTETPIDSAQFTR